VQEVNNLILEMDSVCHSAETFAVLGGS
jgi:hypothetical protein